MSSYADRKKLISLFSQIIMSPDFDNNQDSSINKKQGYLF